MTNRDEKSLSWLKSIEMNKNSGIWFIYFVNLIINFLIKIIFKNLINIKIKKIILINKLKIVFYIYFGKII